jgi:hypothetical protein
MAWHQGYALSQTLFTSLHMYSLLTNYYRPLGHVVFKKMSSKHNKDDHVLISKVLRAFCIGVIKSCDAVIQEITSEHYYEEEDFVTQTFAQYMLNDSDLDHVVAEIQSALDHLHAQGLSDHVEDALRCRLELRIHLLTAFEPLTLVDMVDKTESWTAVLDTLARVNDTVRLGQTRPDLFSERVQRHLASNSPPTPMIKTTWDEAYPRLQQMANDNIEAYRLMTIDSPSPLNLTVSFDCRILANLSKLTKHLAQRFAWDFSSRNPQPFTYSRAVMQGLLFKGAKVLAKTPHLDLLLEDIRSLVLVGDPLLDPANWQVELPSDPRYQSARHIDEFMSKAMDEYTNIPRMVLQNRCRMRRTFCQSVSILDGLQAEAENADAQLHELSGNASSSPQDHFYPLAAWAYFHKLRVIEWSVQLGFELEVYQHQELAHMYRFLGFVAHTRADHLSHIDLYLHLRKRTRQVNVHKQRKDDHDNSSDVIATQITTSQATLAFLAAQATLTADLASALSSLYALCTSLHLIKTPASSEESYSTAPLRHEVRMKPYLPIGTPTLPSHSDLDFATSLSATSSITSVLETISARLASAKKALATVKATSPDIGHYKGCEVGFKKEVQGILGSIIAAGLSVAVIKKVVVEEMKVKKVGDLEGRRDEVDKRIKVEDIAEKRFLSLWAVPKIVGV